MPNPSQIKEERHRIKKENEKKVEEIKKRFPFLNVKATALGITMRLHIYDFNLFPSPEE